LQRAAIDLKAIGFQDCKSMFAIYECGACLLAVTIGATLLFTACVLILLLVEGGSTLAPRARTLAHSVPQFKVDWVATESRDS
jgi:hypothetical protein